MPDTLRAHPYLSKLTSYASSPNKVEDEGVTCRLCYNESPFGASPKAIEAIRNVAAGIHRYPEMSYRRLHEAIGKKHTIDPARIVCGAGSDDLLVLLMHAFIGEGDEVIHSEYGYSMYPVAPRIAGGVPVSVPEIDLRTDLNAMLRAVTPRTKAVLMANPNNPTGSWLTRAEINAFLRELPPHILFVYDAAYAEFMEESDYSDGLEWAGEQGRVVVTRTFSKIYGLSGLRLGWCYGSHAIVEAVNRVRPPFNVSLTAECAGVAALQDDAFAEKTRRHNAVWRERLFGELQQLGLKPYPSQGNFMLVRFSNPRHASDVFNYLKEQSILIRRMAGYGLADCLRISIGREEEMTALIKALHQYKGFKG
jgi:histidinol-phosphate aminotransferase